MRLHRGVGDWGRGGVRRRAPHHISTDQLSLRTFIAISVLRIKCPERGKYTPAATWVPIGRLKSSLERLTRAVERPPYPLRCRRSAWISVLLCHPRQGLARHGAGGGYVVALHAPWGSGKTSALNLLQRHLAVLDIAEHSKKGIDEIAKMAARRPDADLEAERGLAAEWNHLLAKHAKRLKTTVIRFNPWYFSGQENLFKVFFGVLGTEVSIAANTKVAKAIAAVLKRSDAAGSVVGAATGLAVAGPAGAATGATIGGFFGKLANDRFDKEESLEGISAEIARGPASERKPPARCHRRH